MADQITDQVKATEAQALQVRREMAAELLADLDDGNVAGSVIRWEGHEIWVHTTGQVEGWVRSWMEHQQITAPGDADRIADLEAQRDALLAQVEEQRAKHRRLSRHVQDAAAHLRRCDDLGTDVSPEEAGRLADRLITAITDPLCLVCGTAAAAVPGSPHVLGRACRPCVGAHNERADGHRCTLCRQEVPDAS